MTEFQPPVREDLRGLVPYGAPQLDVDIRLNVNENPFAPSPELARALGVSVTEAAQTLNRYPDRECVELRQALADYLSQESSAECAADSIWVANGSNEVMSHIMAAFGGPGRVALTFPPTYSMYPEYARESFTTLVSVPRTTEFQIDMAASTAAIEDQRPSVVLLASPNNPTGTAVSADDIDALAQATAGVGGMLVVDEAYAEFRRPGQPSSVAGLADHPNTIVTRTMSKAFAMAGARVGYAAAEPSVIDALRVVRLPYHLSAVTQSVACTALAFVEELQSNLQLLRDERDRMRRDLESRGFVVTDSDANFCFFGRFRDRRRVWKGLMDRGVLIRETGPDQWLRVSVGTPQENARFIEVLDEVVVDSDLMSDGDGGST